MADAVAAPSVATPSAVLPNLDRIIRGLLYVYIFSLPFKRLLFIERNGFIILCVLLVLWCAVNRRHFFLRTPIDLPLLAFIAWVGFTVPFATFPAYSSKEFAKLLQQGLIFYTVVFFFRDPVHRWRLAWMLIGELALVSAYGIWQFDTKPWLGPFAPGGREYHLIESFLSGDVALTTYLVMLAPLSAAMALYQPERWKRVFAGGSMGLAGLCQFLTFSRAGLLAIIAEAIVLVLVTWQKRVACWAGGVVLTLIVGAAALLITNKLSPESLPFIHGQTKFTTYNLDARINIWFFGLKKLVEHPLVGIGYGKDNFFKVTGQESTNLSSTATTVMPSGTHNTFLDVAVGAGVPALAALLWLLWAILRTGFGQIRSGAKIVDRALPVALIMVVTGMVVRNSFDHMWIGSMAVQFWVLVGLAVIPRSNPLESIGPTVV